MSLYLHTSRLMIIELVFGIFAAITTRFALIAPYGKHSGKTALPLGPNLDARVSWILMEAPAPLIAIWFYYSGHSEYHHAHNTVNILFLSLYLIHYIHRSFIFPFRMRGGHPMPIGVMAFGAGFNMLNGYLQARWLLLDGPIYTVGSLFSDKDAADPTGTVSTELSPYLFIFGLIMYFYGFMINIHADDVLRNLRKPGETGYKIPYGGMFQYTSCANYTGEILEWTGAFITSTSPAYGTFAVFTLLVLGSRAYHSHEWYLKTFPEYPKQRTAVIPYIY